MLSSKRIPSIASGKKRTRTARGKNLWNRRKVSIGKGEAKTVPARTFHDWSSSSEGKRGENSGVRGKGPPRVKKER